MSILVSDGHKAIFDEIKALSCFLEGYCQVSRLTAGESHLCFKVIFIKAGKEKHYFVKSLAEHQQTSATEISSHLLAAEAGFAPRIIFHSTLWLVCEFIAGDSLANFDVENLAHVSIDKVMIALNLMVKTHQLKPSKNHPILDIKELLIRQKNQQHVTPLQDVALNITISKIVPRQADHQSLVLCHGDVNYENIRLSDSFKKDYSLGETWLVDYECSYLAEAEYDIAMFIAINRLCVVDLDVVIQKYQQYSDASIDKEKVSAYLACCFLINGLWYFEAANESKKSGELMSKARQQFDLFDQLELLDEKVTPLFS